MNVKEIYHGFSVSLKQFNEAENALLKADVSERAITHKLAEYLQRNFKESSVDCEYNRNGQTPKHIKIAFSDCINSELEKLKKKADVLLDRMKSHGVDFQMDDIEPVYFSTYPDIIVHKRGYNHPTNLLVLEVKKANAVEADTAFDYKKLEAFTCNDDYNDYQYKLGIHLTISDEKWVEKYFVNGKAIDSLKDLFKDEN